MESAIFDLPTGKTELITILESTVLKIVANCSKPGKIAEGNTFDVSAICRQQTIYDLYPARIFTVNTIFEIYNHRFPP
jgi:hypothetical protein